MHVRPLFIALLVAAVAAGAAAAERGAERAAKAAVEIERIVAVVNTEVVTHSELSARVAVAKRQLARQGVALPSDEVLERQVLERLIVDRVQLQFAAERGMRVDDAQLDQAVARIAESNKLSLPAFRKAIEQDGLTWARFREDIRQEMLLARLREREIENRVVVSDAEVDHAWEAEQRAGRERQEVDLGHVIVRVPESSDTGQVETLRARAREAQARLRAGDDFARVAAAFSDASDALQGGRIGLRSVDRLPALYAEAARALTIGAVSEVLRSAAGFHVLKLFARKEGGDAAPIRQTRARHILLRPTEVVPEADVRHRLTALRERLRNGEDFAELARVNSQDGTASKGGDLGWAYPGDMVPDFERAMDALAVGEISEPVRSPFGWHLIQVLERRTQKPSDERQKIVLRQALRERKLDEAYQDWLRQIRDAAYVEIRLETL